MDALDDSANRGRWRPDEVERFNAALKEHGRQWALVAHDVRTRTATQCKTRMLNSWTNSRWELSATAKTEAAKTGPSAQASK